MTWAEQAAKRLDEAGIRNSASRRQVIELLAAEQCALTALEIDDRLESISRATVYRTLEDLEHLHIVQRVEIGKEAAGYERLDADGHHHHLVCESCGRLTLFASETLEEAIEAVGRQFGFEAAAHDVVLRGRCAKCRGSDA